MQRAMEFALGVSAVDDVNAFRCSMIALSSLRPDRVSAQRNLVALEHLAGVHQFHRAGFLVNDEAVSLKLGMQVKR